MILSNIKKGTNRFGDRVYHVRVTRDLDEIQRYLIYDDYNFVRLREWSVGLTRSLGDA